MVKKFVPKKKAALVKKDKPSTDKPAAKLAKPSGKPSAKPSKAKETRKTIEQELVETTGVKPRGKNEDFNAFAERLAVAIDKLDEDTEWEKLSKEAQDWYSSVVEAINKKKDAPGFPDAEDEEDESEGEEEEGEAEEGEESEEEEDDSKKKPVRSAKKKPAKEEDEEEEGSEEEEGEEEGGGEEGDDDEAEEAVDLDEDALALVAANLDSDSDDAALLKKAKKKGVDEDALNAAHAAVHAVLPVLSALKDAGFFAPEEDE